MLLTQTLLGFLNRVFNKDPASFLGMTLVYTGGNMTWTIADGTMTTAVTGGAGHGLTIDLSQYTVASLATYIGSQTGYSIAYVDSSNLAALSALVLIDGSGDLSVSNGGDVSGYTSILWSYMNGLAVQLGAAATQIAVLPAEMETGTADSIWLDLIGDYYGVERNAGELDPQYGPRIIATVIQPKGNNKAIEAALTATTGQAATVTDAPTFGPVAPVYDAFFHYDGTQLYNGTRATRYGLFDVSVGYDLLGGTSLTAFQVAATALIETFRDAGTHLRAFNLLGSSITDTAAGNAADGLLGLVIGLSPSDMANHPSDSLGLISIAFGLALDSVTKSEAAISLSETWSHVYAGLRLFDGTCRYNSGVLATETV